MRKTLFLLFCFFMLSSHDMFLKLDGYFLAPKSSVQVNLLNGTFEKSENAITRDRMIDVSILENGKRTKVNNSQWTDKDSTSILNFETGDEGTYVIGVSTKSRDFEMDAEAFNSYLEHDGVLDMLEWRKANNAMDDAANERYAKHVKTIIQVGEKRTEDWSKVLAYPIEFVPLNNPYLLHTGDQIEVQLLLAGKPLADQYVYVGSQPSKGSHSHVHSEEDHDHSHEHGVSDGEHSHDTGKQLKTNEEGIVSVDLNADGIWYLRTISIKHSEEKGLTHESNWATLTFEVTHAHHLDAIPKFVYILGALLLIGLMVAKFARNQQSSI